jgi:L-fuculose-phosphate aldolase
VAYGEDLYKAYFKMEIVEHFAHVALVAELLGGPKVLARHEVAKLFAARERYGVKSRAGMEPGMPLVAEDVEAVREKPQLTREDLIGIIDEALRSRGVLT